MELDLLLRRLRDPGVFDADDASLAANKLEKLAKQVDEAEWGLHTRFQRELGNFVHDFIERETGYQPQVLATAEHGVPFHFKLQMLGTPLTAELHVDMRRRV